MGEWSSAVPSMAVAMLLLVVPGACVLAAGWSRPRPWQVLLAPALSVSIIGVAAVVAPVIGLSWSLIPIAIVTALVAAVAWLLRRRGREVVRSSWSRYAIAGASAIGAAGVLSAQFVRALIGPEAVSQTFDNIVHLASVAFAIDTRNASAFHIGATSDIPFYPNGWHAFASSVGLLGGADVPTAVSVTTLAMVSVVWPASVLALVGSFFGDRPVAYVTGAGLTGAFALFPVLLLDFGVLYPNVLGYSVLPALLAAVIGTRATPALRAGALIALLVAGTALAHPNALLAGFLMAAAYTTIVMLVRARERGGRRALLQALGVITAFGVAFLLIWPRVRTSAEHSQWDSWGPLPDVLGQALFAAPRGYSITVLVPILLAAGVVATVRRRDLLPVLAPFAIALALFGVAAGLPTDNWLRVRLTNPWYNDSYRLAALLPLTMIPVMVAAAVAIADAVQASLTRARTMTARALGLAAVGVLAFSTAFGPNVRSGLERMRTVYAETDSAALLSTDERELLKRLPEEVPEDALIAGNPRTGASLAYALAGRDVLRLHAFGDTGPDEEVLRQSLNRIGQDPAVCRAIDRLGVTHVLDFGPADVWGDGFVPTARTATPGYYDLQPSANLVLLDSEGPAARLFEIRGC